MLAESRSYGFSTRLANRIAAAARTVLVLDFFIRAVLLLKKIPPLLS
jgi:hypothetical protein